MRLCSCAGSWTGVHVGNHSAGEQREWGCSADEGEPGDSSDPSTGTTPVTPVITAPGCCPRHQGRASRGGDGDMCS